MNQLSVIIITKNEADNIRRCLESVKFADEIIVLDSGSTDDTVSICQEFTDKVTVTEDWPGYAEQKQRAIAKATSEWVLAIDADEEVSPELQTEIMAAIAKPGADAYRLRRLLVFNDKIIKYGPGENHIVRLFRREKAYYSDQIVHEKVLVNGEIADLSKPLWHYSFSDVDDLIARLNHYSSLSAEEKFQQDTHSGNMFKALGHGLWMFIKMYVLRRGILDGKEGFTLAVAFAGASFYRYVKLSYK